jgi:probable rRNA maturation factor
MISFSTETLFELANPQIMGNWLGSIILQENLSEGEISVVFCDDNYLYNLNVEFLNHDTLTDVIGFNYSVGKEVHGEVFISVDLSRVLAHGILHFCGYNDKTDLESSLMRTKEDFYLNQLMDKPL